MVRQNLGCSIFYCSLAWDLNLYSKVLEYLKYLKVINEMVNTTSGVWSTLPNAEQKGKTDFKINKNFNTLVREDK